MSYQKKLFLSSFILPVFFTISSCSPLVYYVGDTYPQTSDIQVFYNAKEIKREYKVIGHMTKEIFSTRTESDKNAMIKEARKRGADGIIFSDLTLDPSRRSDQVTVKADLIKF